MTSSPKPHAAPILCFGEILWDGLPEGLFLGGAPFNVAYHLRRLGADPFLVSAVGDDFPGREALGRAEKGGVECRFVRTDPKHETGNVRATLDSKGNATYEIAEPVAWDFIEVSDALLEFASGAGAVVFGSLALRERHNREALGRLLDVPGPVKMLDVNLRPPFDREEVLSELCEKADFLKLNEEELERLSGGAETLEAMCSKLAEKTSTSEICVTLGGEGALFWHEGATVRASSPPVTVADTVGAGDAFMAALTHAKVLGLADPAKSDWLEFACRVGAKVASMRGATPDYRPQELV